MLKVTLDTNILPADDIVAAVATGMFEFAVVSVTDRELGAATHLTAPASMSRVAETGVWDESTWDSAVWAGPGDRECLEQALSVISEGSFPPPAQRAELKDGQRRQLRDAMILCAHVRDQRHVLVTNDERGFVRNNRREKLERMFHVRIMTRKEFLAEFGRK